MPLSTFLSVALIARSETVWLMWDFRAKRENQERFFRIVAGYVKFFDERWFKNGARNQAELETRSLIWTKQVAKQEIFNTLKTTCRSYWNQWRSFYGKAISKNIFPDLELNITHWFKTEKLPFF